MKIMDTINDHRIQQLRDGLLCIDGEASSINPFSGKFRLVHQVATDNGTSLYQVQCTLSDQGSRLTDFKFCGQDRPLEQAVEDIQQFYIATYLPRSGVYWRRWFGPDQVSVLDTAMLTVLSSSSPLVSQMLFRINDLLSAAHPWIQDDIGPVRRKLRAICRESYAPSAQQSRITVFK